MRKTSELLTRAAVIIVCSVVVTIGATFNGVLNPGLGMLTLALTLLVVVVWQVVRWWRGWVWHQTPLDGVFLLWALAFGLSLLVNADAARRSLIGLWYAGVYIGVWYLLLDALANRRLKREQLVDALLITGVVVYAFGYIQLLNWAAEYGWSRLPRPVSVFGNPNFLGAFLTVLLPLALARAVAGRSRFVQGLLALYVLLGLVLLALSNSRGAWLGTLAGGVVLAGLLLAAQGRLSLRYWREWWQTRRESVKAALVAACVIGLIAAAGVGVVFVRSFSVAGRDTGLRTELYLAAVQMFVEKPITGHGLFTYGRELVRLPGIEPDKPHSHAHNIPLQVAAELGLVGLAVLVVTMMVIVRAGRRNWQALLTPPHPSPPAGRGQNTSVTPVPPPLTGEVRRGSKRVHDRVMLAGAMAAVVAFAVHQLTDVPAMMPAIALTGLIALVLVVAPAAPQPVTARWRRVSQPAAVIGLWAVLLLLGWWSGQVYEAYYAALKHAADTGDYRGGAERLQPVIEADPNLSLYHLQQGFLYGMAANDGDMDAAREAVAAYQRFLDFDPGYALAWANLAALRWQLDERESAVEAMSRAVELDPEIWQYSVNLGMYTEAMGNAEVAEAAYQRALTVYPDIVLYPEWRQSPLRERITDVYALKVSPRAMTVFQLESGRIDNARRVWTESTLPDSIQNDGVELVLALEGRDRDSALERLLSMERRAVTNAEQAWVHLGRARVARYDGNDALAEEELNAAREVLQRKPLDNDDEDALNIAYAQFLRLAIPRWFLPQVYYPVDNPVLVYMIENT